MRSGNPALNASTFDRYGPVGLGTSMTLEGAVNRTILVLALLVASASFTWYGFSEGLAIMWPLLIGCLVAALVVGLVTAFKHQWAPVLAPTYALLEGVVVGGVSVLFESMFPGIVLQAVALTFGILAVLLVVYKSGLIPVTENFRLGVAAATGAVLLFYVGTFVLRLVGVSLPFLHDGGPLAIGISVVIIVIASLNLVLDFDFIERGAQHGAPKHMEWYAAFGLMVTLVWLYFEILHLLSMLRR